MARMRSRARSQVQTNTIDAPAESTIAFDTNVVIQSPATVMDDSTASIPPPSSSTLWEIEMPVATTGSGGSDVSHESHFAAAAAIAVLGRGGFNASSEAVDVVPGIPSVSAVGVSSVGGETSNEHTVHRSHGITSIVMPMNISVVSDEIDAKQSRENSEAANGGPPNQQEHIAASTSENIDGEAEKPKEQNEVSSSVEAEGDSVIRLKFLDDTQRDARTTMTDTIGKFKSVHFGDAVAAGRVVRLIYQGQLLREDSRTLASYGLRDGCVVHCHISNTPYARQAPSTSQPVAFSSNLRYRDATPNNNVPSTSSARPETQEFRYPRWAVALLLYTYRFPLIGLPLDAVVRYIFDRQLAPSTEPGIVRRTYRRDEWRRYWRPLEELDDQREHR
ncbi:ubiquitin family protein [Cooperia oncophora]